MPMFAILLAGFGTLIATVYTVGIAMVTMPIMIGGMIRQSIATALIRWSVNRMPPVEYNTDAAADLVFNRKPRNPFQSIFDK